MRRQNTCKAVKKRHRDRHPLSRGAVRQRQVRHHPWWGTTNLAGAFGYCHLAKSWTFMGPCFRAYPQGLAAIKPALRPPIDHRTYGFPSHLPLWETRVNGPPGGTPGALTEMRGEARTKKCAVARLFARSQHHSCKVCASSFKHPRVFDVPWKCILQLCTFGAAAAMHCQARVMCARDSIFATSVQVSRKTPTLNDISIILMI